jgi:hypothetical protein
MIDGFLEVGLERGGVQGIEVLSQFFRVTAHEHALTKAIREGPVIEFEGRVDFILDHRDQFL